MARVRRKNKSVFARTKKELVEEQGASKKKKTRWRVLKVRIKKISAKKKRSAVKKTAAESNNLDRKEELVREAKELYWRVEREKRMVMWSGVTFFMLLIAFFWFYNLRQVIEGNSLKSADNISLSEITGDMGDKFARMQDEMAKIKEFAQKADSEKRATGSPQAIKENMSTTAPAAILPPAGKATSSLFLSSDDLAELKEKIEEKAR